MDKVRMYILKIFITSYICHFGLASLIEDPWAGRNSCQRQPIGNYFELHYHMSCNFEIPKYYREKLFCYDLVNLRFFAFLRSSSYL